MKEVAAHNSKCPSSYSTHRHFRVGHERSVALISLSLSLSLLARVFARVAQGRRSSMATEAVRPPVTVFSTIVPR